MVAKTNAIRNKKLFMSSVTKFHPTRRQQDQDLLPVARHGSTDVAGITKYNQEMHLSSSIENTQEDTINNLVVNNQNPL